jgi:tellurite resistance protein
MSHATVRPARLEFFPISFFSVVMGLCGLTIATQKVEELAATGRVVSTALLVVTLAAFLLIAITYAAKLVRHRAACVGEFNDPIRISFFPAFSIALLLVSISLLRASLELSLVFWCTGVVLHLVFTLVILTVWVQQSKFEIQHMSPAWFLPVVGNILVPIAGVTHAPVEISWFFFSVGLVVWTILQALVFYRIFFHHPLPAKLLPTLFILLAPPAVALIAYVKLSGNLDSFAMVLYYYALFLFVFLAIQFGMLRSSRFFLSWWAYSFPVAALAIASALMYHETGSALYQTITLVVFAVLVVIIGILVLLTGRSMVRREICVEE